MDSKNLKDLCEAYGSIYEPEVELTEEQVWEEVETWVNSLIEEGYDLSECSWEEMYEAYISEEPKKYTLLDLISKGAQKTGQSLSKGASGWSSSARSLNPNAPIGIRSRKPTPTSITPTPTQRLGPAVPDRLKTATPTPAPAPASGGNPPKPATSIARGSGPTAAATPRAKVAPTAPAGQTGDKAKDMDTWAKANPKLAAAKAERDRTRGTSSTTNPLMSGMKSRMSAPSTPSPTTATTALKTSASLGTPLSGAPNLSAAKVSPSANVIGKKDQKSLANSFEWGSTSKLVDDIANAYQSVYEAKKVDQDEDGDNDFADVRIARLIASGVSKEEAIRRVKDKSYNEEVEIDEATRMRKELGKEGETATRKELARRSNAYQRSGSVDRTIAAAERGAKNPYVARGKNETEAEHNKRKQEQSQTLTRLAANRRGSVRDKPRAGLRGYAAKVEGDDRDLQSARGSARSAGTLTPAEKKGLGEEFDLWVNALIYEGYDLSDYTWDEMIEIYDDLYEQTALEQKKAKEEALAARRARIKELTSQGRVMTSSKRTSEKAKQSKEKQRLERLERLGDDVLRQVTGGSGRVSDKPMGSGNPAEKEDAPEATRRLRTGLRRDDLGTAADDVLKKIRKEK